MAVRDHKISPVPMTAAGQDEAARVGFIFDCDGTLMDTIDAWHAAEDALLAQAGIELTKEQSDQLNTLTLDEAGIFFHRNFDVFESPAQVIALIEEYLLDFYRTKATLKPGVAEFLAALERAGAPMAVLSSSPQSFLRAGLGRAGILDIFQVVVSVDDVAGTKRDCATYCDVCQQLGLAPWRTWFFDDSWYALSAAGQAGLRPFGIHSADRCGTHGELARFAVGVKDDFSELDAWEFLKI